MDNEILENGAPETEEIREAVDTAETVETAEPVAEAETAPAAEAPEAAPAEKKNVITDTLAKVADKGKELIDNPKPLLDKIKAVPKKIWAFVGAGIAALIVIAIVLSMLGNTYKTPIKAAEKLLNSKSVKQVIDRAPALLNGFGEGEAETLIKIAKKTDYYKDNIKDIEDTFDEAIEMVEDTVGKNYKVSLKVTDKEKLEKDDLKAFRNNLRSVAELGEYLDELDNDDYDDMGISKSQVKKAVKTLESFCDECKEAKVQKGYELTVEVKLTGKELDEPVEFEVNIDVFKVNGRWVPGVFTAADKVMESLDLSTLLGLASGLGDLDVGDLMGSF